MRRMRPVLPPVARRPRRLLMAVALLLAAPGCGDGTGPATTYALVSVNGDALPASDDTWRYPWLITGGTLTLGPGRRMVLAYDVGCASPLPPTTTCVGGPVRTEGTYSREAGSVTFGTGAGTADTLEGPTPVGYPRSPATAAGQFGANEVRIAFTCTAGCIAGRNLWIFQR